MKKSAALIFILFLATGLFAQFEGEITGKVSDFDSKQTIPSAYITLRANSLMVMQTVTDPDGVFTLKPLQPGTYDIFINAFGYDTAEFNNIVVEVRGFVYQEFEIKSGIELIPVQIYAPLVDKTDPTVIETFDAKDFNHRAIDGPIDVAKQAPTVQENEQSGGLYIGGSREDATLYVVDGVKVIGSLYLPMKAIKQINVITGGIPANYGDVTGGIVEIITKSYTGI